MYFTDATIDPPQLTTFEQEFIRAHIGNPVPGG